MADEFLYRACWSFPIIATSSKRLGSLAVYYPERREPTPTDIDLSSAIARTAATIIMRH